MALVESIQEVCVFEAPEDSQPAGMGLSGLPKEMIAA
jgi:hypothetical protein